VRIGQVNEPNFQKLQACVSRTWNDEITATHLCTVNQVPLGIILTGVLVPLKAHVEAHNKARLDKLTGPLFEYKANDTGIDKHQIDALAANCPAPSTLILKKDAQVRATLVFPSVG